MYTFTRQQITMGGPGREGGRAREGGMEGAIAAHKCFEVLPS